MNADRRLTIHGKNLAAAIRRYDPAGCDDYVNWEGCDIARRIALIEADGLAGIFVQVAALEFLYCNDSVDFDQSSDPAPDFKLAIKIIATLRKMMRGSS